MKRSILGKIQALTAISSSGPSPTFSYPHVCRALLLIGDEGAVGRIQLSKELGLGEGTIRTIIRHLSRAGMIRITRLGCTLTSKGLTLHKLLRDRLSRTIVVDAKQLALDSTSSAVLVRGAASKVRQGIEQRDAAVRTGATGACTVLMKHGRFVMPMGAGEWELANQDSVSVELKNIFHPIENDVIIIASAKERHVSDYAVIAAGLTLVD